MNFVTSTQCSDCLAGTSPSICKCTNISNGHLVCCVGGGERGGGGGIYVHTMYCAVYDTFVHTIIALPVLPDGSCAAQRQTEQVTPQAKLWGRSQVIWLQLGQ